MNFSHQLIQLILDFYRENPDQYRTIATLRHCHLSRQWGTLRIQCGDPMIARALTNAIDTLQEPIAQLRLARRLKILANGGFVQIYSIG